jgi:hypothetical protein
MWSFENCHSMKTVTLPSSVTILEANSFARSSLESIYIPDTVTQIDQAFANCKSLKHVRLPQGITHIGPYTFSNTAIENMTIPNTVTFLGTGSFQSSKVLKSVEIPVGVNFYDSVFDGCSSLEKVTFYGNSVTPTSLMGQNIFRRCVSLTSLQIPDNTTSVGWYFAKDCIKLTDITFPNSLTVISSFAFQNTSATCVHYDASINRSFGEDALSSGPCTVSPTLSPTVVSSIITVKPSAGSKPTTTRKPTTTTRKPTKKRSPRKPTSKPTRTTHSPSRKPTRTSTRTSHSPSRKPSNV